MANEVGFFHFDTDAGVVAGNIVAALDRIQAATGRVLEGPSITPGNIGGTLETLEQQARRSVAQVKDLFSQLGQGTINPAQFKAQYERLFTEGVKGIPQAYANALGNIPDRELAKRGQFAGLAQQSARDYVETLQRAFVAEARNFDLPTLQGLIGSRSATPVRPEEFAKTALASVSANPVAVGQESTELARLRNLQLVEQLALERQKGQRDLRPLEQQLGVGSAVDKLLAQPINGISTIGNAQGTGKQFVGTPGLSKAIAELEAREAALQREATAANTALERQEAAALKAAAAAEKAAAATAKLNAAEERALAIAADPTSRTVRGGGGAVLTGTGDDRRGFRLSPDGRTAEELSGEKLIQLREKEDEIIRRQQADLSELARRQALYLELVTATDARQLGASGKVITGQGDARRAFTVPNNSGEAVELTGSKRLAALASEDAALERQAVANERNLRIETERAAVDERRAASQSKAAARQELRDTQKDGFSNALVSKFTGGGSQGLAATVGTQIASAASYTLAYGALFGLQSALKDTLHEFLDYQDSLTDLQVATRDSDIVTGQWVNSLGELARVAGENTGAALDAAARGVRAFTTAQSSANEVTEAGTNTAKTSAQLALITGKTQKDVTGDIIASGTAFGIAPSQLDQIVDAVANAKRTVGGDSGQISQGLASIGLAAQQAGFNLNEAAAVIGLVQARTDESGIAIATRLTRIFQIVNGSTGKSLGRELNIDTNGTTKDQLEAYAKLFANPSTSEGVKDRITSALGGTANLRELLPLLKENSALQNAYSEAINNSGQGTDEFNRKSNNLNGTLKKIAGDLSRFQIGIAKSGIFDAFGLGLKVLEPGLHTLEVFINSLNVLTEKVAPLRSLVGVLLDLAIASKVVGTLQASGIALGALSSRARGGAGATAAAGATTTGATTEAAGLRAEAEANLNRQIVFSAEQRALAEGTISQTVLDAAAARGAAEAEADVAVVAEGAAGGAGRFAATRAGGAAIFGGLASGPGLAIIGVVGALYGIGKLIERQQEFQANAATFRGGIQGSRLDLDGTSDGLHKAADDLRAAAGVVGKQKGPDNKLFSDNLKDRADALDAGAERVFDEEKAQAAAHNLSVFGDGAIDTVQELADGIAAISASGGTAIQTLHQVTRALLTPPPVNGTRFSPASFSEGVSASIQQSIAGDKIPDGIGAVNPKTKNAGLIDPQTGLVTGSTFDKDEVAAALALNDEDRKGINDAIEAERKKLKIGPRSIVTDAQKRQLIEAGVNSLQFPNLLAPRPDSLDDLGKAQTQAQQKLRAALSLSTEQAQNVAAPTFLQRALAPVLKAQDEKDNPLSLLNAKKLSRDQVGTILNPGTAAEGKQAYAGLLKIQQDAASAAQALGDPKGIEDVLRYNLRTLQILKEKAGSEAPAQLIEQIALARKQYRQQQISSLDNTRQAAEAAVQLAADRSAKQAEVAKKLASGANEVKAIEAESDKDQKAFSAQLQRVRIRYLRQEVARAGTDKQLLESLFEQSDKRSVDAVIAFLKHARQVAFQALAAEKKLDAEIRAFNPKQIPGLPTEDTNLPAVQDAATAAQQALHAAQTAAANATITTEAATVSGDDSATGGSGQTAAEKAQEAAAIAAARAQANAARIGGGLATARGAIEAAKAQLAAAEKGSADYYGALAALYQAQQQYADALESYHNTQRQLQGDFTDPVEQARDTLAAAREKLRRDAGRGKDVKAADVLEVRQAEAALENSKFSQRLSDIQTNEQLGRISFQAYVRYLEHESDRLHKIKDKTRQQLDEQNQIDQALQEAVKSVEGAFNIGDINTAGLVYQVRRFFASDGGKTRDPTSVVTDQDRNPQNIRNTTVNVNGADLFEVKKLLRELLGPQPRTRTVSPRRVS